MTWMLIAGTLVVAALVGPAASGGADEAATRVHPDIAYALRAVPGGTQIDEETVVWPHLDMRLDVVDARARAVGSCATGAHCAYRNSGMGGSKLTWTSCLSSHSTGNWTDVSGTTDNIRCTA